MSNILMCGTSPIGQVQSPLTLFSSLTIEAGVTTVGSYNTTQPNLVVVKYLNMYDSKWISKSDDLNVFIPFRLMKTVKETNQ